MGISYLQNSLKFQLWVSLKILCFLFMHCNQNSSSIWCYCCLIDYIYCPLSLLKYYSKTSIIKRIYAYKFSKCQYRSRRFWTWFMYHSIRFYWFAEQNLVILYISRGGSLIRLSFWWWLWWPFFDIITSLNLILQWPFWVLSHISWAILCIWYYSVSFTRLCFSILYSVILWPIDFIICCYEQLIWFMLYYDYVLSQRLTSSCLRFKSILVGTVNIHPSLLPLYRGAAPVQRALQVHYLKMTIFSLLDLFLFNCIMKSWTSIGWC